MAKNTNIELTQDDFAPELAAKMRGDTQLIPIEKLVSWGNPREETGHALVSSMRIGEMQESFRRQGDSPQHRRQHRAARLWEWGFGVGRGVAGDRGGF